MGTKAWMAILGLGFGSVVVMGFLTKMVVDSNPQLQDTIRFKSALAESFKDRGLEQVSLRKLPQNGGYQLLLTATPAPSDADQLRLDADIAEYFAKNFSQKHAALLRLSYLVPQGMSCSQAEPYREQEVSLQALRVELSDRERRKGLEQAIAEVPGWRLLSQTREGGTLVVDVEAPASFAAELAANGAGDGGQAPATGSSAGKATGPTAALEAKVEKLFTYDTLRLRVYGPRAGVPAASSPPLLLEASLDRGKRWKKRR